jgi:hypothetical protein
MAASEPTATWWFEYQNGDRSTDYDSEAEAWAAIVDLQFSYQPSRPAWLFSSSGQRFLIPTK